MKDFYANFTKSYAAPTGRQFQHPTMVRHKGVVIALAMDDQRRIFYAILDMNPVPQNGAATKSPFDINNWPASPTELIFPNEIAEVGFGVADQTLLPAYQKGSRTPVDPGTRLESRDKDFFLSTTARLTADAPFQALSDGRYVYIFRQAIDANHADMVFKRDKDGNLVKDNDGNPVPLVEATLLVDRFILVGIQLVPKLEVRFQRSRSKTRPQSRKDSLGAKDLDGNDFFEPTQELKFVGNLNNGRFTVLLLPTQVAELQRWQIFAQNRHTGLIDSFNVERSAEGLFNTRGSQVYTCVDHPEVFAKQAGTCVEPSLADPTRPCGKNLVPRFSKEGYAESALKFENASDHVALNSGVIIGEQFTQEAWIYPTRTQSTLPQALITGDGADKNSGPAIWLEALTRLRVGFGDGQNWQEFSSKSILTPNTWNHLAVTFDGAAYRFYIGGNLRDKIDLPSAAKPVAQPIKSFGAAQNSFSGTIDEIRLWNRVRSSRELQADMHQRLTGLEPGLVGYWRFDEAEGDKVYDQTNNGANGTKHGGQWVTSNAPVGENPGVNRSSFQIATRPNDSQLENRSFESGMTAMLYYQQANVPSGYEGKEKPLKQNARVMLAVATKGVAADGKNYIAALDFGVSSSGRIAQAPDRLALNVINPDGAAQKPINDQLEEIRTAEAQVRLLSEAVVNAKRELDLRQSEYQKLQDDLNTAQVSATGVTQAGTSLTLVSGVGEITFDELVQAGLNDRIQALNIPEPLQVTVYEHANWQGQNETFKTSITFEAGSFWRTNVSGLRIAVKPEYDAKIQRAEERLRQARSEVTAQESLLNNARKILDGLKSVLRSGAEVTMPLVYIDPLGLSLSGGLLGFAWTNETPLLFDSATGTLALYFRGADDQFFAAYFNTFSERARYPLTDKNKEENVMCVARSTDLDMDKIVLEVSGAEENSICTVTISGAGIEETWTKVPRASEKFARVLNGEAGHYENKRLVGYREYIGAGFIVAESQQLTLRVPDGVRRALEADAALQVGETRVAAQETVSAGATSIPIASDAIVFATEKLPIFFMEYDYAANAQTTKVPSDLFGGSLLIRAVPTTPTAVGNQRVTSGATVTSKWTAAAPGSTLTFDGESNYARLTDPAKLKQLDVVDDVTLEAWVRPNYMKGNARVIQHQSSQSNYTLGLHRPMSALTFDGSSYIDLGNGVTVGASFTQEAWIYPTSDNENYHGFLGNQPNGTNQRPPSLWVFQKDKIHAGFGDGENWNSLITGAILTLDTWNHVAATFDGTTYRIYVNGLLKYETAALAGKQPANTPIKNIGRVDNYFNGRLDEIRIWKRARTAQEIQADMNRRLSGNEADLTGYWHFEAGAKDYSRSRNDGALHGQLTPAPSALPVYAFFAGVNGKFVQSREIIPAGDWSHLAAVFAQDYGLKFDGVSGYLDGGKDDTLNINTDLTIEAFLQPDDLSQERGILTRGQSDDGTEQNVPYALSLDRSGHLVFTFEDTDGENHSFTSSAALAPGTPHRVAVTRKQQTLTYTSQGGSAKYNTTYTFAWHDIVFYLDNNAAESYKYTLDENVKKAIELAQLTENIPADRDNQIYNLVASYRSLKAVDIGRSDQTLEIGRTNSTGFFKGIISEVRIWNASRDAADIGKQLSSKESGLVSWWRFEEREGNKAADSAGQNHATLNGNVKWTKDPDLSRSRLILYCNDSEALLTDNRNVAEFGAATEQFSLGALGNSPVQEFFQGELEEVRIWKIVRSPEQIQDSLFRRLNGELDSLIAYYTFDAETENRLTDQSLAGNHLTVEGTPLFILSTAPIGEDAPQVRSALAGVRTPFSGVIHSRPSVHEYGDLQYDNQGNLIGVFKRCYGLVKDNDWQLITGFKVGDLVTEWIGQVQFALQLIGYIEGAPPVPSENLTQPSVEMIGDLDDYNEASVIELAEAAETTYTYSASKEQGFGLEVEAAVKFGFKSKSDAGLGFITSVEESKVLFGLRAQFEAMWSWMEEASTGVSRATGKTTSLELRGRYTSPEETTPDREPFGRRFVSDNVGLALVQSETADVFALRLRHNNALISFQMRPNPDIPKDWNIIMFPINPRYVKQGTLDGKIGPIPDIDYPNALTYSSDSSYFKPVEAYALKNQINREETELETYFNQFAAADKGRLAYFPSDSALELAEASELRNKLRRNLVNTYVWTSDGGLFAEMQQTMDVQLETFGGSYDFTGKGGIDLAIAFAIAKVAAVFELNAMFVGHHHLSVNKSKESKTAFQMNVNLDKVERDIYKRDANKVVLVDNSDPKHPKPIKHPYKVDAYRFMTFYLEPESDHFDLFFNRVVDPIWLAQSDDPAAVALREARDEGKKPACWRIIHRVTYVSRVLPPLDNSAPPSLEKTLQTLDIDSNYELIKQLEPYVSNKLTSFADFADAVRETIKQNLPELQPHTEEVIKYMSLYFGIADSQMLSAGDDKFGESSLFDLAPNQPPIVNAGLDQTIGLDGASTAADLDASVIDDRLQKAAAIFVTWEKLSGEANVTFDDPHVMKTKAAFTKRGRYVLRLTASDGLLTASDDLIIIVNERPIISAGPDQQVNTLQALLTGQVIDSGLGDPQTGTLTVTWSKQSRTGEANFANKNALATAATFTTRGHYLLKLSVSNGTFDADDEVMIAVAARSTEQLQALYTFEENNDAIVHDVAGTGEPLDLVITDPAAVQWVTGGLAVNAPALLATSGPATRLVEAVRATNEITIEAWIKPASLNNTAGSARIATLANSARTRNFLLGQRDSGFHAGLRTTTTNANASNKVLAGGTVNANQLSHLVCTREASGLTRLYLNGNEVSRRVVEGNFSSWDTDLLLALGNEPGVKDGYAWLGNFHLVAIYSRALTPDAVKQNFGFGADANLPPIVSAGPDKIIDWQDIQLPKIATTLDGRVTHDRPTQTTSINWTQAGGPGSPNGVTFENEDSPDTKIEFNQKGRYVLRLTADDGELLTSDEVVIVVNRPPQINIKTGTEKIALTASAVVANLVAELIDSGLGDENAATNNVTYKWSGPASVQFTNADTLQATARFTQRGVFALKLEASNGRLITAVPIAVTVNQKPVVNAGATQIVTLPITGTPPSVQITLAGAVTDTGLGNSADTLDLKWEKVSGPEEAIVDFADATQLQTTATFTVRGVYILRLTAINRDNPELTASAVVAITVNERPLVDAGPDLQITLPEVAVLDGMVSDDGLPNPPGTVRTKWTKVSGPGSVIFADDTAVFTSARFSQSGDYVLRLTANDYVTAISASDEMTLKVLPSLSPRVLEGLQVLYLFDEGTGDTVHDVAGVGAPIDLRMQPIDGNAQPLQWLGKGLRIIKPAILKSNVPATRLINALKASNALTIEAWVKRAANIPIDRSPGRIITLSGDIVHRDFTLGQLFEDRWQVRLRTTETDEDGVRLNNGRPAYQDIDLVPELCHVAYTRDTSGKIRFYLNGTDPAPSTRPEITGNFSNWADYELALANELSHDRPWLGEYYLIAIYNRALSRAEVRKNLAAQF